MGGTDDPSNLVEVSVEEHAELHFALYLEHGKYEDYIAYNMLAGKTGEGERALNILRAEYMRNRIISEETREKMRNNTSQLHTPEADDKRSKTMMGEGNHFYGKTHHYTTKEVCRQAAIDQWQKTKYIWITNGVESRRVAEDNIPEGFVRGRKINKDKE